MWTGNRLARGALWGLLGMAFVLSWLRPLPAAAGPVEDRCWDGEWSEDGPPGTQRFAFMLRLTIEGERARGAFTWRQIEVSWSRSTNGSIGQEFVQGTLHGGRLTLAGVRVSPGSNLATDRYRMRLLDNQRVEGQSASLENDWSGRLRAREIPCPARGARSAPRP